MGILGAILGGVVGFFVGGPVGAAIGAGLGATKAGEKVINSVLDFVLQPFLGAFGAPDSGANEAQRQQGVLVQREGSNVNIPVIYGLRKVGGIVTFAGTGSDKNKYLWVAYVFSEGLVEGLQALSIDDVDIDGTYIQQLNAGQLVDVAQGKYSGRVKMRWYPGYYYSPASTSPVGSTVATGIFDGCPDWKSTMNYNGLAVLFARYEWKEIVTQTDADNNPFTGGIPKLQATILGRRVQTLATKSYLSNNALNNTASATMQNNSDTYWYAQPAYSSNTGVYSTNPVEILHDYLRNNRYGKGLALSEMDKTTWVNAANKCNQNVQYYTGAIGPIMTCNYVLDTGQTLFSNVKTLLSGFRGYMPYVQGKYKLKIEDAGNATDVLSGVATIAGTAVVGSRMRASYATNVYEIVGDVTYTGIERTAKYNQVAVTYVDPDQKWSNQQAVWPQTETERQVYIAEDGNRENKGEMTMGTITNPIMALDMARLIFNKSRFQESCSLKISAEGFELEPGDNIYVQSNILNFGTIPWRIITIKLNNDYTFDLGCVRNPDTIYPYGRYNEPDDVLGPHIPKGNSIYYSNNSTNIGILPPNSASVPPGTSSVPSGNVTPTVPTNPVSPGGGIGAPDAPTNKNPPIIIPSVPPATGGNDIVDYTSAVYSAGVWTINFTKTNISQYAGVRFWYKPSTSTTYTELPELSSGATSISFAGSTDTSIVYTILSRVKYANGNYSVDVLQAQLSRNEGLVAGSEVRVVNFQFAPSSPVIDGGFTNLAAKPFMVSATNSSPLTTPKTVTFVVQEPVETGINPSANIRSIKVYYKPKGSNLGYNLKEQSIAAYSPNSPQSVTINDFGTSTAEYDIAIQFTFANGSSGNKMYMDTINVTTAGAVKAGNPYYIYDSSLLPLAQPTTPVTSDAFATVINISGAVGATSQMLIRIKDPTVEMATWNGVKVYVAKLIEGQTVNYNIQTTQTKAELSSYPGGDYGIYVTSRQFDYRAKYKVIIVLTYALGNVTVPSTMAVKFEGLFHGAVATTQLGTNPSTGLVQITAPAGTFVNLFEPSGTKVPLGTGQRRILVPNDIKAYGQITVQSNPLGTPKVNSFYIDFTVPSDFSKVRVYRRRRPDTAGGVWGPMEYTDFGTSGYFRHAIYATADKYLGKNGLTLYASDHEIYTRLYDGSGVASSSVVHYFVTGSANAGLYNAPKSILTLNYDINAETAYLPNNAELDALLTAADANLPSEDLDIYWYDCNKELRTGRIK